MFWQTFNKKEMIMDGLKVRVAESVYWIQQKERIVRLNYSFFFRQLNDMKNSIFTLSKV